MFKTLGIRTLVVFGVVTLIVQQPLAAQVSTLTIGGKGQIVNVKENDDGQVIFKLTNTGKNPLLLSDLSFKTPAPRLSGDESDGISALNLINFEGGPNPHSTLLTPSTPVNIGVTFTTPDPKFMETTETMREKPKDFGDWNIIGTFAASGLDVGPNEVRETLSATVQVNDTPEPSTLVLVGICALSVCGFGWLRRRRTLSEV